jgi:hypothetical protein
LSPSTIRELSHIPKLRGCWVAVDPRGPAPGANRGAATSLPVALRSGEVVVDADAELDVLCARLSADRRTSLTIFFNRA